MFKPKPKTLPQLLIRAVVQSVLCVAMFGAAFFAVSQMPANTVMPEQEHSQVERPTAKGSPAWFIEKYDCWTGEAPADMQGKMPGHVIVTEANRTYRGGPVKVGTALAHIFEGAPTEIEEIHAFCR